MNDSKWFSALAWVCCAGLNAAAFAAPPTTAEKAPPPAAAASVPLIGPGSRERPVPSPAVRAAQNATTPGDLRPENPVVPQLAVPLRRERPASGSDPAGSASAGEIDDAAARCRAAASDRERAACARSSTVPVAPRR